MVRCPICNSPRVVVVLSPRKRAYCVRCGSIWIQDGRLQRAVRPGMAAAPAIPPIIAR